MSPDGFTRWLTPDRFFSLWLIGLLWVLAVATASILVRRSRGKPVLFFSVPNAVFQERTASGCSNDRWWRRFGGANNCLVVAITRDKLVIRPFFPFNLMFAPEMYGLEHEIPLSSIVRTSADRFLFRRRVRVHFREGDRERDVSLFLKRPDEFLAELKQWSASEVRSSAASTAAR